MNSYCRIVLLLTGTLSAALLADDWPQFQGPTRDGVWHEEWLVDQLPADGPPVTWRATVSGGYAGPAVADGRVFVTDYVTSGDKTPDSGVRNELEGTERVLCFAESSGDLLWKYEYERPYRISYPAGPRATPTVDGDRVYVLGAEGDLLCLQVDSGEVLWRRQLQSEYNTKAPMWGYASHPLIDGDKLFTLAGGEGSAVVALDKMTGKEIWRALSTPDIGYSPATMIKMSGQKQLLIWHSKSLNSLNPHSGEVYWSERLEPDYSMSIAPPLKLGDRLFVGAIKFKSMALGLPADQSPPELLWLGKKDFGIAPSHCPLTSHPTDPNHIYGVDRGGDLRCVNAATGDVVWSTYELMKNKRYSNSGTAFLVRNGDRHLILSETGELILAKLSPEKYEEISRTPPVLEPTHDAFGRAVLWSPPAFANGAMFVRNDKELVRLKLD